MLIDIHQHLVYGVDDGPADLGASLAMLRQAAAQGVGEIVCTSHDAPGIRPLDRERYLRHLEQLRAAAADEGIPVRLHSGCELLMTPEALGALKDGRVLTLGDSRCVLTEFYPDFPWQLMHRALRECAGAGYRPVLAHAERYACLREMARIGQLRSELGVTIQVNAATVLDSGRLLAGRWTRQLLATGLADIAASDAHGTEHRPCRLGDCYALLEKRYGQQAAARMCGKTPAELLQMTIGE